MSRSLGDLILPGPWRGLSLTQSVPWSQKTSSFPPRPGDQGRPAGRRADRASPASSSSRWGCWGAGGAAPREAGEGPGWGSRWSGTCPAGSARRGGAGLETKWQKRYQHFDLYYTGIQNFIILKMSLQHIFIPFFLFLSSEYLIFQHNILFFI